MPEGPLHLAEGLLNAGLLGPVLAHFYAFTLALVRISGLMIVGPLFGTPVVPINVRVLLVIALTLLVAPAVPLQQTKALQLIDQDRDGRVSRSELPPGLQSRFDAVAQARGLAPGATVSIRDLHALPQLPPSLLDYAVVAVTELALGFMLGFGVFVVLSGLQLAGELIDQQTGTALGEVFNPSLGISGGLSGQALAILGLTVFVVMTPLNGHLKLLAAFLETFQTFPLGSAFISQSAIELLRDLVHQSLVLAIQVAAPVLAAMSLVALTMGFLGHTTPQVNVLVIGFPVRAMIASLIVALSFSGAARIVIELIPASIDRLHGALAI